jgi:hypothetical protein
VAEEDEIALSTSNDAASNGFGCASSVGAGTEATGVNTVHIIHASIVAGAEATGVTTVCIVRMSIRVDTEATWLAASICAGAKGPLVARLSSKKGPNFSMKKLFLNCQLL